MTLRSRGRDRTADAIAAASGHGGRLAAASAAYPRAPRPWLDLSTGVNPQAWPGRRASREEISRLPDPGRLADLEAAAARAFGVAEPARVVATAGAEAGLRGLARRLPVREVDIVAPTYSGHEAAWRAAAVPVWLIRVEDVRTSAAAALVLVNPNNPDGRVIPRDELVALAEARDALGLWTIVDESFVETAPDLSVADLACERLLVLRSFGKFYGLPGLRLGFVVAAPEVADELRVAQGEWPVGAEAIEMGIRAYADGAWRRRTQDRLRRRASRLDALLARSGLEVLGGTSLFRLAAAPDAHALFDGLCRAGVLTRPFADRPAWLRFGMPRDRDFPRLDHALTDAGR